MPRIDVEAVLGRVSGPALVPFIESIGYGPAIRAGREHKILCPFHDDHKPSLTINTTKRAMGILWCPPCGWKGSIVDFVGEVYRISGEDGGLPEFIRRVNKIAELTGQKNPERPAGAVEQRASRSQRQVEVMTPRQVAAAWMALMERAVEPEPWAKKLGIEPEAMRLAGAIVVPHERTPDRMLLAVPMRRPDMVMTSAQFRCFATRRKWALDEKQWIDGEWVQVRSSNAGLFLCPDLPALEFYHAIIVEGMTDFLGGLSILIRRFGTDLVEWPCQFIGLPGVTSLHDMVLELPIRRATTFFDPDEAGMNAAFDARRRVIERGADGEVKRGADGKPIRRVDMATDRREGLLGRMRAAGIEARASRPPTVDGRKVDLRDMARDGWDYDRFEEHLLRTSTRDPMGIRFRR